MLLIGYGLIVFGAVCHIIWHVRNMVHLSRESYSSNNDSDARYNYLCEVIKFAKRSLILSIILLLSVSILNAFSAWHSQLLNQTGYTMQLFFGVGAENNDLLALGLFGIYFGIVFIVAVLTGLIAQRQLFKLSVERLGSQFHGDTVPQRKILLRRRIMAIGLFLVTITILIVVLWVLY